MGIGVGGGGGDGSSMNTLSYNTMDRTLGGGSISPDEKPPEYLELCGEITEAFLTPSHALIERSRSENDLRMSPVRTPPPLDERIFSNNVNNNNNLVNNHANNNNNNSVNIDIENGAARERRDEGETTDTTAADLDVQLRMES